MPPSPNLPTPPLPAARPVSWTQGCVRLVRHKFWLKFLGITAFMWLFFVAYFYLLRHPARAVTVMPLTMLDRWLPFQPGALAAYVSLWFYVGIPPGLMPSLRQAAAYGLWVGALCAAGLACFYFLPTAVPAREFPVDLVEHPGFQLLQGVDASGNACPSLHVATALFSAAWIQRLLRQLAAPAWARAANALWVTLIVYSTLAIGQHVVLDVVGGALLALLFAWPSLRWLPGLREAGWQGAR